MIVRNEREQALECSLCGELLGISDETKRCPAAVLVLMAGMGADHQACEEYLNDPRMARAARDFRLRMRHALRGLKLV
jgi:hypothetical protein